MQITIDYFSLSIFFQNKLHRGGAVSLIWDPIQEALSVTSDLNLLKLEDVN